MAREKKNFFSYCALAWHFVAYLSSLFYWCFLPCETQDFASLLFLLAFSKLRPVNPTQWRPPSRDARFCVSTFLACVFSAPFRQPPLNGVRPVETQDFASHEKVSTMYMFDKPHVTIISLASPEWISTMYMHKKRLVLLVFPVCETQDFASLLSLLAFSQLRPVNPRAMASAQ